MIKQLARNRAYGTREGQFINDKNHHCEVEDGSVEQCGALDDHINAGHMTTTSFVKGGIQQTI
jgi:hypothetical protein